jgi:hypothetical protein
LAQFRQDARLFRSSRSVIVHVAILHLQQRHTGNSSNVKTTL